MNKNIKTLYQYAIQPIFEQSKHKRFITQNEFEKNMGTIFILKTTVNNPQKELVTN